MRRTGILAMLVCALALACVEARATTAVQISMEEQVATARAICRGRVSKIESRFVEGRIFYDASQLEKALDAFQTAIAEIDKTGAPPLADLHYYAGDTLVRLERPAEAEYHLQQELRAFPQQVRARGVLAALYQETGRTGEAGEVLETLLRLSPTPEAYSLAARLWTSFGSPSQASAVRAEAARASTGRRTAPAQ